jgi:hypothetical protein
LEVILVPCDIVEILPAFADLLLSILPKGWKLKWANSATVTCREANVNGAKVEKPKVNQ